MESRLWFSAVEGDDSMLGTLSTMDGNTTNLTLRSTLRRGKLESLQVVVKRRNCTSGSRGEGNRKGLDLRVPYWLIQVEEVAISVNMAFRRNRGIISNGIKWKDLVTISLR